MRTVILYHPNSEQAGPVLDYARDFKRHKNKELELISLEALEGAQMAKLYDITVYPAVLTIQDNGQLQRLWQGGSLPLMNELEAYARG
jgi:hypothetical protein